MGDSSYYESSARRSIQKDQTFRIPFLGYSEDGAGSAVAHTSLILFPSEFCATHHFPTQT